jgi:hypothetical protein
LIGDSWNSETGWGLQVNSISDNEHKIPLIDWATQTFSLHEQAPWSEENKVRGMSDTPVFDMSLDSFIKKHSPALV